jgi:SAM-dependent methyltransferase
MSEHRYLHSVEQDDAEFKRLALQAGIIDPNTIRHLEMRGVSTGWKCLEVGAGAGSIAQWLSRRVGPAGRVVATDIDLRFLQRVGAPNLEVRRHDILNDELEKDAYDLVHCRLLLLHLHEPERALRRMAEAVHAGGWLLAEEWDCGSILSADVTDPSAASFTATLRAGLDFLRRRGITDQYFGCRLRGLFEQLGWVDVGHEGWAFIVRGGDPFALDMAGSWLAMSGLLIPEGVITREQAENAQRLLLEPSFSFCGPIMFSAWGRKPVSQGGGTTS